MKEKFKKGVWVTRLADDKFTVMTNDTGYGICSTVMCDETDEANAHLIAAAPKMYKFLDDLANGRGTDYPIEKLLAEARGEG